MEKRYDFQKHEKETQEFWEREGIYRFSPDAPGRVYSIDTPPPTVSGSLHIGHLFSYAQAEMIARFHRMQGENVYYPFGFDDNGLPTERLVEREKKLRARDLPHADFTELCRETASRYEADFRQLFQSLGFSVDWDLQYETASPETQRLSQKLFLEHPAGGQAVLQHPLGVGAVAEGGAHHDPRALFRVGFLICQDRNLKAVKGHGCCLPNKFPVLGIFRMNKQTDTAKKQLRTSDT